MPSQYESAPGDAALAADVYSIGSRWAASAKPPMDAASRRTLARLSSLLFRKKMRPPLPPVGACGTGLSVLLFCCEPVALALAALE